MSKALKAAIEANDPVAAQQALKTVKDVNRRMAGAGTPLLHACENGADQVLGVLFAAGAQGEKPGAFAGDSPFAVAATHQKIPVMERLLELGKASTAAVEHALEDALMEGRVKPVRLILERVKPVVVPRHFRLAAHTRHAPELQHALKAAGGNINGIETTSGEAGAPLHFVAASAKPERIRQFVENGADVNVRSPNGGTPLMWLAKEVEFIVRCGRSEEADAGKAINTLIELGADGSLVDAFGNDALAYLEFEYRDSHQPPELRIVRQLRQAGAVGSGATGRLINAITNKDLTGVKVAIQDGADVNRVCPGGFTPLICVDSENLEIVDELLKAGADPNKFGRSSLPLVAAARSGDLALVKRLLGAGADLHALEPRESAQDPCNAYRAAEVAGEFEVVDYLKSIGGRRPVPIGFEPLKPGVASWNDFSELLVNADVAPTAQALAAMIEGTVRLNAWGQSVIPGRRAFVVARPKGMKWSNVFQVAPPVLRSDDPNEAEAFARRLARESGVDVIQIEYSDTSDAASINRFSPRGDVQRDQGWDRETLQEIADNTRGQDWARRKLAELPDDSTSSDRVVALAEAEQFVVAAFGVFTSPGRPVEIEFAGYPAEAFDAVAYVTSQ